jgi:hypothetical protein
MLSASRLGTHTCCSKKGFETFRMSPYSGLLVVWTPKILAYTEPISDLEVLQQPVDSISQKGKVRPGIFERVGTSVRQRAESRVDLQASDIKHQLQR